MGHIAVGVLLLLGFGFCNAQVYNLFQDQQLYQGLTQKGVSPAQDPVSVQIQQRLQVPVKKLTWHFPQVPATPEPPRVHFDPPQPVQASSVAVECRENTVHVQVRQDFFGTGELINPAALTLGDCAVTGQDTTARVFIFDSELQNCKSVSTMTDSELVYTFWLQYNPQSSGTSGVLRTKGAAVGIECHYPRLHNVSSNALMPAWIPYAATVTDEERLVFSLRLMMDDWQFERPSNLYYLGDFINIEASVIQYHHVPLMVFVDHCVATAVPDVNSTPRYSFIDNNGCLVDAKLTGSRSHFMLRTQGDKLQFQLEAFVFQQQKTGLLYFTCFLKATAASAPVDAVNKACSYTANGWSSADANAQVCGCCDSSCASSDVGRVPSHPGPQWDGTVSFGPVAVKERPQTSGGAVSFSPVAVKEIKQTWH